jgi:hypothetical protein
MNVDDQLLLVVIFKAELSVGAVKYFALTTVESVAEQIRKARLRDPDEGIDLVELNLVDASVLFTRKSG